MLRKTLTILSLIGLLLSVGLWGVSYLNFVAVTKPRGPSWRLGHGCFAVRWGLLPSQDPLPPDYETWTVGTIRLTGGRLLMSTANPQEVMGAARATFKTGLTFFGFKNLKTQWLPQLHRGPPSVVGHLQIPFWILALAFASMLMLCYLPSRRRRKRKKLGLCLKCGYDLRASKDRCPECGEEFGSTNGDR